VTVRLFTSKSQNTCKAVVPLGLTVEDVVTKAIKTVGSAGSGLKYFINEEEVDKETSCFSLNLNSDSVILAIEGQGEPSVWQRFDFKDTGQSRSWYNSGSNDALNFTPTQNILMVGFSTFCSERPTEEPQYEINYEIKIDGSSVLKKDTHTTPPFEEQYFCRNMFEEPIPVSANQKITIVV